MQDLNLTRQHSTVYNNNNNKAWNLFGIHLVGTWNPNVCQSQSSKSWTTGLSISSGTVFPSELCVNSILGIGRPSIWRRSATAALICILQSMWNSYYMWYFLKQSKWNLRYMTSGISIIGCLGTEILRGRILYCEKDAFSFSTPLAYLSYWKAKGQNNVIAWFRQCD